MTVILVDAKNALFRYGFAQRNLQNEDGIKTGAVYGVLNCLLRLKKRYRDARFILVWDGADKHLGWRFKLNAQYQHNRRPQTASVKSVPTVAKMAAAQAKKHGASDSSTTRAEILAQMPLLENILSLLGLPQIKVPTVEADDVIAILAMYGLRKLKWKPIIYSSDKDFIQLLQYGVMILRNVDKQDRFAPETATTVLAQFGCTPEELVKVRAIAGDESDGLINPVRGVGVKTAAKLVAMGVDPSKETTIQLNVNKLDDIWRKLYNVWPTVHLNYRLMRLPHHWTDREYDEVTSSELSLRCREVLEVLRYRKVQRMSALKALAELNLLEAIDARKALFSLQV